MTKSGRILDIWIRRRTWSAIIDRFAAEANLLAMTPNVVARLARARLVSERQGARMARSNRPRFSFIIN
jgi:hypothetical protein